MIIIIIIIIIIYYYLSHSAIKCNNNLLHLQWDSQKEDGVKKKRERRFAQAAAYARHQHWRTRRKRKNWSGNGNCAYRHVPTAVFWSVRFGNCENWRQNGELLSPAKSDSATFINVAKLSRCEREVGRGVHDQSSFDGHFATFRQNWLSNTSLKRYALWL